MPLNSQIYTNLGNTPVRPELSRLCIISLLSSPNKILLSITVVGLAGCFHETQTSYDAIDDAGRMAQLPPAGHDRIPQSGEQTPPGKTRQETPAA